jgi:WD40 repeat protein
MGHQSNCSEASDPLWVTSVAFSPEGTQFAAGIGGSEEWIRAVAFSLDGETLASSSAAGTVPLWIIDPDVLAQRVCNVVRRDLAMEEWALFMGDDTPYQEPCPGLPGGEDSSVDTDQVG